MVKQKYVLLLSCLQRVAVSMIRFTQRTISESFGHGKHRGLLVQDVAALGSEHSSSSTGTAGEAEAATFKGTKGSFFAGMNGMDVCPY